ncbi:hypothetical protein BDN72DRAFT_905269 [Pluteus cervinus]|uniref:Uncharacterized protein n=1 Tax=Pluteus cervinus TaxID=181527 RepID=A0ACD3A3X1_9AGAR|nr:hypothetical protein BDN72DRAFT_905269 [Pluteus cervinus]
MPRTWTTVEQKGWLGTKVAGFIDARARGRSTAYAKSIHHSFSEIWPELDALFVHRTGDRPINLNAAELDELKAYKKKRGLQIFQWLQRNSTQRGRLANRAVKVLMRNHGPRRRRTYQLGEIYNKLYPERVSAVYQERKVEGLSRGQRLNLIKKISDELLEGETDEVKEEVLTEQVKRRDELDVMVNGLNSTDEVDLDEMTLQQYIDQLPELLTSVVGEINRFCPDWGFLVLASGPMPKANNATHVFDIYSGPKTVEGYTFAEAHEGFDTELRIPFGNFVEAGIVENEKRAKAKEALDSLKHTIKTDESDVSRPSSPVVYGDESDSSRSSSPVHSGNEDDVEEDDARRLRPAIFTDSEDEGGNETQDHTTRKLRRATRTLADSEDDEDDVVKSPHLSDREDEEEPPSGDNSSTSKPFVKHPLEIWPIEGPDSAGEEEVEVEPHKPKYVAPSQKKSVAKRGPAQDEAEPLQGHAEVLAAKREESTRKRLETRKINREKKEAAEKVAKEAEVAKRAEEEEVAKKAKAVEVAKKTKEVEAAKKTKKVEAAKKTKEVEAAKKAKEVEAAKKAKEADATSTKKKPVVNKSKNAASSAANTLAQTESSPTKTGATDKEDGGKAKKPSKSTASTTKKATKQDSKYPVNAGDDDWSGTTGMALPTAGRRPAPAILPPPPPVAASKSATSEVLDAAEDAPLPPPKTKGKKATGRKRPLEEDEAPAKSAEEPAEEPAVAKRPRREIKAPKRADSAVPFTAAKRTTRSRRK